MTTAQKIIKYAAMALAVALIAGIFSGIGQLIIGITVITDFKERDETVGETASYEVNGKIDSFEIDVTAATVRIENGADFAVSSNFNDIKVKAENGRLKIEEESRNPFNVVSNGMITVVIPEAVEFDKVSVNTGASAVYVESLNCKRLNFDLGAGNIYVEQLKVTEKAEMDCGIGELQIKSGSVNNLALSHGVGKADINAVITGKSDIEAGIGELKITVPSDRGLYTVEAENGIGEMKIDGEKIKDGMTIGDGENIIKVEGGIGSVRIDFDSAVRSIE